MFKAEARLGNTKCQVGRGWKIDGTNKFIVCLWTA